MKDERVLHAAYDDSQKVTASFIKNILVRLNRYVDHLCLFCLTSISEYGADFNIDQFEHHVEVNKQSNRVEIYLESTSNQTVCTNHHSISHIPYPYPTPIPVTQRLCLLFTGVHS